MNKIVVTPGGRRRYLEVLLKNLNNSKDEFDKWILWVNTTDLDDIKYMERISSEYDYIELQYSEIPVDPNGSHTATICNFFKKCIDENSVYLRLDDDIVYIHKNSIKKLFEYRIQNPKPFLVFGNILNNAIITHLYQQHKIVNHLPYVSYNCEDENGWRSPNFALSLHNYFLQKKMENKIEDFFIENWMMNNFERCSINSISWLGSTFKSFNGEVGLHEEIWLSTDKPKEMNTPNVIFGESLFVHYAFAPQRNLLDSTDILHQYRTL